MLPPLTAAPRPKALPAAAGWLDAPKVNDEEAELPKMEPPAPLLLVV